MSHAIALAGAGLRRADRGDVGPNAYATRLLSSLMLGAVGLFDAAATLIGESRRAIESLPAPWWGAAPDVFAARLELAAGNIDEASDHARAGADRALRLGSDLFLPGAFETSATIALLRGNLREAEELICHMCDAPVSGQRLFGSGRAAWLDARVANARGADRTAMEALSDVYANSIEHRRLFIEEPAAAAWCVRLAFEAGDRLRAEAITACAEQLAAENPEQPTVVAAAAHARGVLLGDPVLLATASDRHVHPWARASADEDLGVTLLRDGSRDAAHGYFRRALDRYGRYGSRLDQDRVERRLRAPRSRRRRSHRDALPIVGLGSLTDTERGVADLVATGLTNVEVARRLFVSRHTVDFHLRQVFRKLEVRSRVELTRLLLEPEGGAQARALSGRTPVR
jgi:DNA-binding CsgD family transcriptional regulator